MKIEKWSSCSVYWKGAELSRPSQNEGNEVTRILYARLIAAWKTREHMQGLHEKETEELSSRCSRPGEVFLAKRDESESLR